VLQHLFLLPLVLVSYWASMRIQWRPVIVAVPLQIILALAFAALAYPALTLGEFSVGDNVWHAQMQAHHNNPFSDPMVTSLWLASFVSFLPTYWFGLLLITGAALYTRFRNSELQRAALEREWSAARLAALRMQLSPHTLFNLLHTIRGLIEWDPKGAQSMVVQLADLLRRLLNAGERDFSRLADELQFARLYLELQQKRFADRLTVMLPRAQDTVDAWVPSLILQPLIENAVVHGLAGHQGPVTVRVDVERAGDSLHLRVTNTIAAAKIVGPPGIGISNVRERLAVQFEGRADLVVGPRSSEWVSEIRLPEIRVSPERSGAAHAAALAPA
jgi:signal transduction histidine kinase